ncbi:putative quinol monooxygenase [Altererythrobacter lutimaris]|uniref:Antibiotic biosynthesis monooxygenase n=1 Tax=Altererythrobacter lutimaris TaxID=2743979 RepID=A0A850HHE9_9SPHN|nr:putative quinol monooxygenase [Altererythrobacter lutimaris]NVE94492.1 antibiotic biosynthesis monooxygenase [Altererythrobacter lutimaris]
MLLVLAEAKLGEGTLETARAAFEPMITASRAEDGCISYAYAQDVLDPSVLHITEKWQDEEALATHFATPHMAEFQEALGQLDVTITELAKYQTDGGQPLR